jgi:hypothetical protein
MDILGDYTYIIIFAGIIIFNILKALRKREKPAPAPNYPENHPYSTTGEEDDFWRNPTPVSQREPLFHQPMVHQPMQSHSKVEPIVKKESKKKSVDLLNEKGEEKNISVAFNNTDDARQAFVYSEIWNRKY